LSVITLPASVLLAYTAWAIARAGQLSSSDLLGCLLVGGLCAAAIIVFVHAVLSLRYRGSVRIDPSVGTARIEERIIRSRCVELPVASCRIEVVSVMPVVTHPLVRGSVGPFAVVTAGNLMVAVTRADEEDWRVFHERVVGLAETWNIPAVLTPRLVRHWF
jgi:hypothetical protein